MSKQRQIAENILADRRIEIETEVIDRDKVVAESESTHLGVMHLVHTRMAVLVESAMASRTQGLLKGYAAFSELVKDAQKAQGKLQQEIFRRLDEDGATFFDDETYDCHVESAAQYDRTKLTRLKEIFNLADFCKAWIPEHDEPVPAKWNMTQVKKLCAKYGDRAKAILAQATLEPQRSLKFGRKEK